MGNDVTRQLTIDEFVALVASEGPRVAKQTIRTMNSSKTAPISVADLLKQNPAVGERTVRYRHLLGPPATPSRIARESERLGVQLSGDLRELLQRINGIHLWASEAEGRSDQGLLPIEEWTTGEGGAIRITYHADASFHVLYEASTGRYVLVDVVSNYRTSLGTTTGELLGWLWTNRVPPP